MHTHTHERSRTRARARCTVGRAGRGPVRCGAMGGRGSLTRNQLPLLCSRDRAKLYAPGRGRRLTPSFIFVRPITVRARTRRTFRTYGFTWSFSIRSNVSVASRSPGPVKTGLATLQFFRFCFHLPADG